MPTLLDNPRQLLTEPVIPDGAQRVRAAVPVAIEVNDPRARVAAPNGEDYDVKIVASTKRVARDGGIIPIEAWAQDLSRYLANPVVLWAHSYREPPVALCVHLEIDAAAGALIEYWRFLTGISEDDWDKFCGRLKALYAVRGMRAASVGFIVREWRDPTDAEKMEALRLGDPEPRWVAARAELLETSCVPVPADPYALSVDRALQEAAAKQLDVAPISARWSALRSAAAPAVTAATSEPPASDATARSEEPSAPAEPAVEPAVEPAAPEAASDAAREEPGAQADPTAELRDGISRALAALQCARLNTPSMLDPQAREEYAVRVAQAERALRAAMGEPTASTEHASAGALDLTALSDDSIRALIHAEFTALTRDDPTTPSAGRQRGGPTAHTAFDDDTLRRIAAEEVDRMLVRSFGFPARTHRSTAPQART